MTVTQLTCANNTPSWNNVIQSVDKGMKTIRLWGPSDHIKKRPFGPWTIVWCQIVSDWTVWGPMVPWQITLEPSQPGRAVSGGLLDRGPLELRLHAADELHHAQLEQHPDRGDCRQEAPNLFLLLPKFDKVTIQISSTTKIWQGNNSNSFYYQNLTQ